MEENLYYLGCDIGGTFTDFILYNKMTGEMFIEKILTTPAEPSNAVLEGVAKLGNRIPDFMNRTEYFIHGTTLVINAVVERKGAKTGLITTKGFEDIIEIGKGKRYDIYDIHIRFPKPLIPRYLRKGVTERISNDGAIVIGLNLDETEQVVKQLLRQDIESIAVCLLHSYKNSVHEKSIEKIVYKSSPNLSISLSSVVLPEIREYERMSTTIVNAYVKPVISKYLTNLAKSLENLGLRKKFFVLLSSGGVTSVQTAKDFPVRIIESGPAAGVLASCYYSKLANIHDTMSFDMGGTTAKMCLVKEGEIKKTTDYEIDRVYRFKKKSGIPIRIPVIDLLEIGAGGGSIAEINDLGLLQVGPRSSGAEPGPACYSLGGEEPTVTDSDLVLGYLNSDYFLGGKMKLNLNSAINSIGRKIAQPLGINITKAARGIHDIVNENMASAAKIHMAENAGDPSKLTMVAFGGAGPVHAYSLAKKLHISKILVPIVAGVNSAFGFFTAPFSFDLMRTHKVCLKEINFNNLEDIYQSMERDGIDIVRGTGVTGTITCLRSADMRYVGQDFEINVPFPKSPVKDLCEEEVSEAFNKYYEMYYGRSYAGMGIEFVNLRTVVTSLEHTLKLKKLLRTPESKLDAVKGERKAFSLCSNSYINHTVYDRYKLMASAEFSGPAIVEERESTTIIGEDAYAYVDDYGNIIISINERKDQ